MVLFRIPTFAGEKQDWEGVKKKHNGRELLTTYREIYKYGGKRFPKYEQTAATNY